MSDGEVEGGAGAGAGGGDAGAAAAAAAAAGAGEGGGQAGDKPWYGELSDEGDDKRPGDATWLKNKGYDGPAALIKAHRELESKLAGDKRIEIPGEDASDDQKAANRAAIGVPAKAEDYPIDIPEGWEADLALLNPVREAAFAAGVPASGMAAIVEAFKGKVMADHNALVDAQNAEREAVFKEWGAQKDQNLALVQRGLKAFGLTADKIQAMQSSLGAGGTKEMLELGLKLGQLSGEDGFIPGAQKSFGISAAEARVEMQRLEKDGEFIAKLRANDSTAKARHERLLAVISQDDERQRREQAAA